MKVSLSAGAELDLLTQDELSKVLRDWSEEVRRGVRFTRRTFAAPVVAGAVNIADNDAGPHAGMVWGVTFIAALGIGATEFLNVNINGSDASSFYGRVKGDTGYINLNPPGLALKPLDRLIFTASGLAGAGPVTVNVQVVELPIQLMWQLLS